jgi:transposase
LNGDDLTDAQWARIEAFVPGGRKGRRGPRSNNRRFVNALIWMARSGGRWRDMPDRFGGFQTVKRRYYRWIEMGVLDRLFSALAAEADLEWVAIDSTSIRAQAQAAGAARKRGALRPRVLAAQEAASGPRSTPASTHSDCRSASS